ncbi:MAG: D-alanyl-D-alanine carboxypeptidase/D-alanyl-D-alanine-endopeptidase, partial [Verrucomicrobiae bacterium]|nr:D-alanyl-D-alanine carboxypeptidase/D-alanyl-D-alanine-endopeptidase [Verrucomicrobiae bacterium]
VAGDVILIGGGDPMLAFDDLETLAKELAAKGIRRVSGRIIGDGSRFTGSLFPDFWDWGDIGNGYGSPVSGLNLGHNRYAIRWQPGEAIGKPANIQTLRPFVPNVSWINEVTTGPPGTGDGIMIHGGERVGQVTLRGTVPLDADDLVVTGAVPDPETFAAYYFRTALAEAGISVEQEAVSAHAWKNLGHEVPAPSEIAASHLSPTLLEMVHSIHATSDNLEAECVYRWLGLERQASSESVIRDHWSRRGLAFQGLRMVDGCGLARADFITPNDLARLQYLAATGPAGDHYVESLIASEDGRLRWKPGAMSGVRSYTGYVTRPTGERWSFALMANHFSDSEPVKQLRDAIWDRLMAP